jgi:hypothetical protein
MSAQEVAQLLANTYTSNNEVRNKAVHLLSEVSKQQQQQQQQQHNNNNQHLITQNESSAQAAAVAASNSSSSSTAAAAAAQQHQQPIPVFTAPGLLCGGGSQWAASPAACWPPVCAVCSRDKAPRLAADPQKCVLTF